MLKSLGEDVRFVGEKLGSAAVLDLPWLSKLYGAFPGVAHSAILCESDGVDLELCSTVFEENNGARGIIEVIRKNAFRNPGAALEVWNAAPQRIRGRE